ncbi:MAG: CRISPR-associated endonuclease Cas1 [Planctomycetota bacterium]|nr:CRISPR-associated endonuclease Cas1 [Planctomycetota bacterium]
MAHTSQPSSPTLAFIGSTGATVRIDGETLVVQPLDAPMTTLPIGLLGGVVSVGAVEWTTASLLSLADRGIPVVFITSGGRVRAVTMAASISGIEKRLAQAALETDRVTCGPRAIALVRDIIATKISAMREILEQHHRTHLDVDLSIPTSQLTMLEDRVMLAPSVDIARGFEGAAVAQYFQCMPAILRGELTTDRRTRMPPGDEINAALSFGYALLVGEFTAAIIAAGLDPALGILHPPTAGRPSLALDLVEPFRHAIIDRLVLRMANRRELVGSDFEQKDGGFFLNETGRRTFLTHYADVMSSGIRTAAETKRPLRAHIVDQVERFVSAVTNVPVDAS